MFSDQKSSLCDLALSFRGALFPSHLGSSLEILHLLYDIDWHGFLSGLLLGALLFIIDDFRDKSVVKRDEEPVESRI